MNIAEFGPTFRTEYRFVVFHPKCCSVLQTSQVHWANLYMCNALDQAILIRHFANTTL